MLEVTQVVSDRARIPIQVCLALAHPGSLDDVPAWATSWGGHNELPLNWSPGEEVPKAGGWETRRETQGLPTSSMAGGQWLPQNSGPNGQQVPWRPPHMGSARPGQLLATGTDTSASLARAVFFSRVRPGAVSKWGSMETPRSHTLSLELLSAVPQEQSPIQPIFEPACLAGSLYSGKGGKVNSETHTLLEPAPLPSPLHRILHSFPRRTKHTQGTGMGPGTCDASRLAPGSHQSLTHSVTHCTQHPQSPVGLERQELLQDSHRCFLFVALLSPGTEGWGQLGDSCNNPGDGAGLDELLKGSVAGVGRGDNTRPSGHPGDGGPSLGQRDSRQMGAGPLQTQFGGGVKGEPADIQMGMSRWSGAHHRHLGRSHG